MMMQNGDQYGFVAPAYPGPPMNNLDQVNPGIVYQQPMTPAIGAVAFTPAVPVVTQTVAVTQAVPVTQVTTVAPPMPMLGEGPGQAVCPTCQTTVVTEVVRTPGLMAWLIVAGIAIFGLLPCAFIPLCVDSCKDVNHHCPCCHRLIYSHKKM